MLSGTRASGSDGTPGKNPAPASILEWSLQLDLDPRVVDQISRYSGEEEDLGREYPSDTAARLRALLIEDTKRALKKLSAAPEEPGVEVTFPDPGFIDPDGAEPDTKARREFEKGFIRTEAMVFLKTGDVTPGTALEAYTDPDFRMAMSSRIRRIWMDNGLSCVEVKGVTGLLSPTFGCNRLDEVIEDNWAAQHSQVVSNPGGDDYQTTYFKESLKVFIAVPDGLVLYYINYTRTVKLGSLKRKIGRGKIEDSELEKIRELYSRLSNGRE